MKAVIQKNYSGISSLDIVDLEENKIKPYSVIVENKFVPVLPYDLMTEYGQLKGIRNVQLPIVVGYGFGGIVSKVGKLRDKKLIGKKVIGMSMNGSTKELINSEFPPLLFTVPNQVILSDATTIIGGGDAALKAVDSINASEKDNVLVTGASGGVGTYVIQLLKLRGSNVIAMSSSENMEFVKNVGADQIINYESNIVSQLKKQIKPNKVIDTVGNIELLNEITNYYEELEIVSLSLMKYSGITEKQSFRFINGPISLNGYKELLNLLSIGKIKAYIQNEYDFKDIKKAQIESKEKHSKGRILLKF
ncbi:zinc-binding dehydrogenase [Companilactobacillus metriopterae]|uniref:zinc-binding dehydrogenase n=1 Tax=Companilactobacillus metriopterae TaxID=1909267 RepID=UPI00100BDC83|nr:zinc-binding dehydrogenase [Companilactobacillus metriopterae]